ncbi:MAG TPA: metal ABC transporter permease [Actinomycetota bacterium]|nr:metal ABC transporter permease [Actinomycetota bacterium]
MSTLLEPFHYEFFQRALVVATVTGALCGLIGVYVVLRGMSYIGHGLSHAIFGGAVASYIVGVSVFVGAVVWGLIAALFINKVARRRSIGADAAIGAITSASFAIGIILISVQRTFVVNFEALLWGNVLAVAPVDVLVVLGVALASTLWVFLRYRQLLFSTFDPEVAEVSGVNTARVDIGLAIMLTATIAATMSVIGVTMIAAMLVIPPVIGRLLTDSFSKMLWISVGSGTFCGFVGVYGSYYLNWSSGGTVVLTAGVLFVFAFLFSGWRRRIPAVAAEHVH